SRASETSRSRGVDLGEEQALREEAPPPEGREIEPARARVGHPADEATLHTPSEEAVVAAEQAEGVRPWPSRKRSASWSSPCAPPGPPPVRTGRRGRSRRSGSTCSST